LPANKRRAWFGWVFGACDACPSKRKHSGIYLWWVYLDAGGRGLGQSAEREGYFDLGDDWDCGYLFRLRGG